MRLSVITPSLNQARYLGECLASVRAATDHAPEHQVEHIVIDGGSTDGSVDLLRAARDVRWISEPDTGQSQAINKGLALAGGDVLAYLCADDLYEPQAARVVLEGFAQNAGAEVVYADYFFLEGMSGRKRLKSVAGFVPERLRDHNPLGQPAVWWRRSVDEKFGRFDETLHYCMDHEYWLRLGTGVKWLYRPEPLAVSRLHAAAKTSRQLPEMWRETARMLTRDGWRPGPWWNAFAMAAWGRHYYRLKRAWFAR
ncbi:MAG: glycosyltransferase family 2 protein [Chthoniobacterales bacterium]|jgi:glycosyltransferase involved in cell wall biosynthesis